MSLIQPLKSYGFLLTILTFSITISTPFEALAQSVFEFGPLPTTCSPQDEQRIRLSLEKEGSNSQLFHDLGNLYSCQKDQEKAIAAYQNALNLYANDLTFKRVWNIVKADAKPVLRMITLLEDHPQNFEALLTLGQFFKDGQSISTGPEIDAAIIVFEHLSSLNSNEAVVQWHLGNLYLEKDQLNKGIQAFQRAKESQNANTSSFVQFSLYYDWAEALVQHQQDHEAVEALVSELIHQDPDYARYLYRDQSPIGGTEPWGNHRFGPGRQDSQVGSAQTYIWYELGEIYAAHQQWKQAHSYFQKAIEKSSNFTYGYMSYAQTLVQLGQPDKAVLLLQQTIKLNPELSWAHYRLAEAYLAQDQEPLAIEALTACYNLHSSLAAGNAKTATLRALMGNIYQTQGKNSQAIKAYETAISHHPWAENYDRLGQLYLKEGMLDKAVDVFRLAINERPGDEAIQQRLARAEEMQKSAE